MGQFGSGAIRIKIDLFQFYSRTNLDIDELEVMIHKLISLSYHGNKMMLLLLLQQQHLEIHNFKVWKREPEKTSVFLKR